MRFALVDNERTEASPNLKGTCPGCSLPVIPKCGTLRIHHWAHGKNRTCDNWWEPETEWHRSWKNSYPVGWQEIFLPDRRTGEKHIADICTDQGLVIEFQHSHLSPKELSTREQFYQNMVWVIDGSRLKRDFIRFLNGMSHFRSIKKDVFLVGYPEECFPIAWLKRSVPVVFDFKDAKSVDELNDIKDDLYCLFPVRVGESAILAKMSRRAFIKNTINGEWISRVHHFING